MRKPRSGAPSGRWVLVLLLVCQVGGCTAGRVTPVGGFASIAPPLKTIALSPSGGVFADLVGIALSAQGYTIIDTGATLALLVLMQQRADDLLTAQVLGMLKGRGIDAVLVVERVDAKNGLPHTARVRLYSTEQTTAVGGVDWENSWMRRGTLEAAQEIAAAMAQGTWPPHGEIGR